MEYIAIIKRSVSGVSFTTTAVLDKNDEVTYKEMFTYKTIKEEVTDHLIEVCGMDAESYHIIMDDMILEVTEALQFLEYEHSQGKNFIQLLEDIRYYQKEFADNLEYLGLPADFFTVDYHKII